MKRALELARRAWGQTHPNPMVGAVILEGGAIVAEGHHAQAGGDHAEIAAWKALGRAPAARSTLYVTLEPCSTAGKTGACTDAILRSGLKRVVVGTADPNPAHAGRGLKILREAGVEVVCGVHEAACRDLNLVFNHWIVEQRPLVAGKIATTLDGRVATRGGQSQWITNAASRADVHHWRRLFPAIAAGSGTVRADDPALTARLPGEAVFCPRRFIFDRRFSLPAFSERQVFCDVHREETTLVTCQEPTGWLGSVWKLPSAGMLDHFLQRCAAEGIIGLYLEGGPTLISAFLAERHLDYLFAYRAPKFLADDEARACLSGQSPLGLEQAYQLEDVQTADLAGDQLMRGRVLYPLG